MFLSYNGTMTILNVIATSHGTDSASGREAIALIREQIQRLLAQRTDGVEYRVHAAYVDVESPSVDDAAPPLPKDEPCCRPVSTLRWICVVPHAIAALSVSALVSLWARTPALPR